uniref:TERF1-interacting nuclear factor 2 N-terminal domain-containing protein n=1 Tax=Oncorhynchus mykiss TaxID=8022 RepID=A0A8C7PH59_ONCMY
LATYLDIFLSFSPLPLLAPPIRLVSAAMWKVMKQRDVMHYGTLEEFVTSCCEAVPGLLTSRHQAKLALGLRSRVCVWRMILLTHGHKSLDSSVVVKMGCIHLCGSPPHLSTQNTMYSALRKYSAPLNFATFCHISGFKHKDIKLYFFVKNQQQVGHNHEVERHFLDISNFFNKSKTEKLGVQNYSAPLS